MVGQVPFSRRLVKKFKNILNPPMVKGGGMDATPPPTGFSNLSQEWEELSGKLNFTCRLILGTSVYEKIFQIGPTVLALKLEKGRVVTPSPSPLSKNLPVFLTMNMTFNLNKFWYAVR